MRYGYDGLPISESEYRNNQNNIRKLINDGKFPTDTELMSEWGLDHDAIHSMNWTAFKNSDGTHMVTTSDSRTFQSRYRYDLICKFIALENPILTEHGKEQYQAFLKYQNDLIIKSIIE